MKKCEFYTNVHGKPELVSGYAVRIWDAPIYWLYFIYKNASSGSWYVIDPRSGLALATFRTRAAASEGARHYHAKAIGDHVYETDQYDECCRDFQRSISALGLQCSQTGYWDVYKSW